MFACNDCKTAHEEKFRPRHISPGQTEYPMQLASDCVECGLAAPEMKLCLACALTRSQCQICRKEIRQVSAELRAKIVSYRALYLQSVETHAAAQATIRNSLLRMDQKIFAALVTRDFEEEQLRRQFVSDLSLASLDASPRSYESDLAPQTVHTILLDSAMSDLTEDECTQVLDHTASFSVGRRLFQRMMDESARIAALPKQNS